MKKFTVVLLTAIWVSAFQFLAAQPQNLSLQTFASNFDEPLDLTHAGDDRIFVVEKDGEIIICDQMGNKNAFPYLDIQPRVRSTGSEQGLLGLAFHPNYQENGYFFVNYTNNNGNTVIARFTVGPNPDVADITSELIMLTIPQSFTNHNGGCIKFGPDGMLYVGMGDGGSGGDPLNAGQTGSDLLGKMLRLDVDNGAPWIPADNPYVNDASVRDEIWAIGVRNPWRFSFDRLNGDMWIADVGQNAWEEIDHWPWGQTPAPNFGWRCYEGNAPYNTAGCSPQNSYVSPVFVYANNGAMGCSVTGGFVYRGPFHANLWGH
ncbi:MAG: PQQ-dependent sugar dehydrogenase, partial [Bacteroidota bacterium]